jgi:hypothetical protein
VNYQPCAIGNNNAAFSNGPFDFRPLNLATQIASLRQDTNKSIRFCVGIGRDTMTNKLKIATVAALLAAGIASPAFAQSADHTGSQLAYYYDSTGKQTWGSWGPQAAAQQPARFVHSAARRSGLHAYAAVPGARSWTSGSFGSGATGGGSIGYNENLRTDY